MIGNNDIDYLSGKISALAQLQAISLGIRMKEISKDPHEIKDAIKKAKKQKMKNAPEQRGYDEIISVALSNAPEDLFEW